ncbi:MAG: 4'-phosphopantetheinyl transferase superfamily protein [Desulfobulbaceae bacterium]|nr:4'-phosphopantetheinyl transferase superfamily protein [Desulfobulbaceae bacterium]
MTRNCPDAGYLFPSVASFCQHRDMLESGLEITSFSLGMPAERWIALVDLAWLGKNLHAGQQEKIVNLLAPAEKKIFAAFSFPKRRIEWLGGRIAAKAAALLLLEGKLLPENFSALTILPGKKGAPEFSWTFSSALPPAVSISHSGGFAAAMAAAAPCGIDIQKVSEKTQRVVSRFAAAGEIQLLAGELPALNEIQRLSLLWAAKEALKKAVLKDQPVFFQGVALKDLHIGEFITFYLQYPGRENPTATVEAAVLGEYILAFTTPSGRHA